MERKYKFYGLIIFIVLLVVISCFVFDNTDAKATPKKKEGKSDTVFVDIKGAVKNPGVYEVSSDSRIIDVIEKAGDLKKEADTSIINLSKKVKDEMYIIIYTKEEVNNYKEKMISSQEVVKEIEQKIICPDSDNEACITSNTSNKSSKININTASVSELSTLSGIGESKAKKIIEYREQNKFNSIEDILNVSGIGKSLYEKIKNDIEV